MNNNDLIREQILRFLHNKYKSAKSVNLARSTDAEISINLIKNGHSHNDIISNFLYLVQSGWIKKEITSYAYEGFDPMTNKTKLIKGRQTYYTISDKGVNHFEGPSIFQKSNWMSGINITNVQGVTVVGNNNYVNQQFAELYRSLELLFEEIKKTESVQDQGKLDYKAEIETIKSQLSKQKPNKNTIKEAWASLSTLAAVEGISQFYERVRPLIEQLLGVLK